MLGQKQEDSGTVFKYIFPMRCIKVVAPQCLKRGEYFVFSFKKMTTSQNGQNTCKPFVFKLPWHKCNFILLWNSVLLKSLRPGFSLNSWWSVMMSVCLRILLFPWSKQWSVYYFDWEYGKSFLSTDSCALYFWKIVVSDHWIFLVTLFYFLFQRQGWTFWVPWVRGQLMVCFPRVTCLLSSVSLSVWNMYVSMYDTCIKS